MKITVTIEIDHNLYELKLNWPVIPRKGDMFTLTDNGWSEEVREIWWNRNGSVSIELGNPLFPVRGIVDEINEGLAQSLLDSGWKLFNRATA